MAFLTPLRNLGRRPDDQCIYVYINPNYFAAWVERSKNPWSPLAFCVSSRPVWRFSVGKTNTMEELTSKVWKVTCFTVQVGIPVRAARICQHYRGFTHVGRCGPQTVRSGQKVDGNIRYSRNPNQRMLRKNVSIIGGDRRSFNVYMYICIY